ATAGAEDARAAIRTGLLRAAVLWIEFRVKERIITPRRIVGRHVSTFLPSKHGDDDVFINTGALELNHLVRREIEVRNSRSDDQYDRFFFEPGFDEFDYLGIRHWAFVFGLRLHTKSRSGQ